LFNKKDVYRVLTNLVMNITSLEDETNKLQENS